MQAEIERLFDDKSGLHPEEAFKLFGELKERLNRGEVRAAEPDPAAPAGWRVNAWVKKGILLGFRLGSIVDMTIGSATTGTASLPFFDKSTYPLRHLDTGSGVRIVPGGSSIRDGVYLGHGVTCM